MKNNQYSVYELFDNENLAQQALHQLEHNNIQVEDVELLSNKETSRPQILDHLARAGAVRSQAVSIAEGVEQGKFLLLVKVSKQKLNLAYQIVQKFEHAQSEVERDQISVSLGTSISGRNTYSTEGNGVIKPARVSGIPTKDTNKALEHSNPTSNTYVNPVVELGAFKEGILEITTFSEQLLVSKRSRVKEELVVSKQVEIHTQLIQEEVRRTRVEVEQIEGYSKEIKLQTTNPLTSK